MKQNSKIPPLSVRSLMPFLVWKKYIAVRYNELWEKVSERLIKVFLGEKKLWKGAYGKVKKVRVWWVGHYFTSFAIKTFYSFKKDSYDFYQQLVSLHAKLKKIGIPTRNTYRHLEWTNKILMTLGNADWSYVFSANNTSKDRTSAAKYYTTAMIKNKEDFFNQMWGILKKAAQQKLMLPLDTFFFRLKWDQINCFLGDLDCITRFDHITESVVLISSSVNASEAIRFLAENCWINFFQEFSAFIEEKIKTDNVQKNNSHPYNVK